MNVGLTLKTIWKIENQLVSVQRVLEFTNIEQEDDLVKPTDTSEWARTQKYNLMMLTLNIVHTFHPLWKEYPEPSRPCIKLEWLERQEEEKVL